MLRPLCVAVASLLLASCGGHERYAVPAAQASSQLAGLGTSPALSPMPAALSGVRVHFENLPDGNGVQWAFRNDDGEKLGSIVAKVEPDGESQSKVTVRYVEPGAPITSHTGKRYQTQLKDQIRQLLAEAVDSTLDGRPFDMEVRQQVELATLKEGFGGAIEEASRRMDQYSTPSPDERYSYDTGRQSSPPPQPSDASKPATDLSRFR